MTEYREILVGRDRPLARITLNRPDKLNAFTLTMADELLAAFGEAEADPAVRAVLLGGAGRAFGAGFDLSAVAAMDPPELGPVLEDHFNPLIRAMRRSRLPIVASVQGACAGAAVGLALACDLVIAGRSAFFYEPFVGIALVPDAGNSLFLPRLVGRIRAAGMALLGERIPAEEAGAWGLVWKVVEDAALAGESEAVASRLAAQPAAAVAATKRLLGAAAEAGLDAQLDLERDLQDQAGRSADCRAAIERFLKR
ncbi:2-(1,2-epoxy-1,2-dihydrophenyl)acetyl-CoA isomerase [Tistlia consotensis]|uniref:2-(1,2-epoxy-1,2-dihydrophenyl)acetyl-CoA isomerase n=1 Tax=Tistlia consotensis USBA 355 TaxID=560819 RepID=A0A1Y6BHU6_9PROT|nr:enoyl-CoA hydratase-related protein [Tistlia consotensis]SMF04386.1 2-(1,2-epoxy-1,2-dihydrophenyl)acetyl-CoA isomerase [Tistlia consotensis USBA 355]SNR54417.1 2-(1,2-epoxy-1,2-dihydrophenyl)acetyl-CoA isomerase [Tistlia consotensis]